MRCAKAGPHWNKNLPTAETSAVELSPYPFAEQPEEEGPLPRRRRLEPFAPSAVELHNGTHIHSATATNLRYMLSLDVNDLLYAWRHQAGLSQPSGARGLRGWESPGSELRGHVLGHWLSAVALSLAAGRSDGPLRARLTTALTTLEACQQASGWLSAFPESFLDRVESLQPVWAPVRQLVSIRRPLARRTPAALPHCLTCSP